MIDTEVLGAALMALGAACTLLAGVGLVRFQDVYMRMSATSKAGTLGVMLVISGAAAHLGGTEVLARAAATVVFFFVTAPVAAHLLGRAAHARGQERWSGTWIDERVEAGRTAAPAERGPDEKSDAAAHGRRTAA